MEQENKTAKTDEIITAVRNGRAMIFLVAVLLVWDCFYTFIQLAPEVYVFYIYMPFIIGFVILGTIYYIHPLAIALSALLLFTLMMTLQAWQAPTAPFQGFTVKIFILAGLVGAIQQGFSYRKLITRQNTDVIDNNTPEKTIE